MFTPLWRSGPKSPKVNASRLDFNARPAVPRAQPEAPSRTWNHIKMRPQESKLMIRANKKRKPKTTSLLLRCPGPTAIPTDRGKKNKRKIVHAVQCTPAPGGDNWLTAA
ncbi:hypothetical protein VTH06DRAFT_4378 [Thermothelomyces fergusii]